MCVLQAQGDTIGQLPNIRTEYISTAVGLFKHLYGSLLEKIDTYQILGCGPPCFFGLD